MHQDSKGKKRKKVQPRISGRDPVMMVEEYVNWQRPQLVITAHKLEDAMERKYRRVSNVYCCYSTCTLYVVL